MKNPDIFKYINLQTDDQIIETYKNILNIYKSFL